MNLSKLYRNPEVKKVTIRYLIILIIGIILTLLGAKYIVDKINERIIDQNTIIMAKVLSEENPVSIINNFYEISDGKDTEKAKEFLKAYGYDNNMSKIINEPISYLSKEILMIFIPILLGLVTFFYICYLRVLNNIYSKINIITKSMSYMSNGEYKEIKGNYTEGELDILLTSLNYMGDRVNNSISLLKLEKDNLKDFLSDISHQLKTPLASLIMFNDLMKENENMPYEDRIKFLNKSEEQLDRMEWLIMNLLKVGRLEANAIVFNEEKQQIKETINLAISSLRQMALLQDKEIIISGCVEAEINHDKEWVAEALSNIIKNAIEHTDKKGKIKIKVDKGSLITKIYISDNGKGIPKEMQEKVFKRFYKGNSSTNPKSIGIGLSLAKSIIEKSGGEIRLISEEGKGTTFIISFIDSLKEKEKEKLQF